MMIAMLMLLAVTQPVTGQSLDAGYGTIIGIDLGTTYSCVGVFQHGHVDMIANDQGNRITPSYVAFSPQGELLVGEGAKNQLSSNPENTIFDVKRLIGRRWSETTVQQDMQYFPFRVLNKNDKIYVQINTGSEVKDFTPEEISAMVLRKMKETAEAYLEEEITHAVVTVPAYFNDAQRQATKDAGKIAGLNVLRILNEATAAAIAYGLNKRKQTQNIMVFDLGGGTFDVSVLTISNGKFKVIATNGDTHLGGEDFNHRVVDHYIDLFSKTTGEDIRQNTRCIQRLRIEVENAKKILSYQHQVKIYIDSFYGGRDFTDTLTRAKFEHLNMDLFQSTMKTLDVVLEDSEMSVVDIDEVVLVGGSTRIPKIQEMVKKYFSGKVPSKAVNPDEAVGYGAAVQGGIMSGAAEVKDMSVISVNPLTLGFTDITGSMINVTPRNTPIPSFKLLQGYVTTTYDNQHTVSVPVYEGEHPVAVLNHFLGILLLTGVKPAPRGVPKLEVVFMINEDGILEVSAEDVDTGNKNHIIIDSNQNRLSSEEIERMIQEAEQYKQDGNNIKQCTDNRNKLESYIYDVKNQLNDNKEWQTRLTYHDRRVLNEAVEREITWLETSQDADCEELEKHWRQIQYLIQSIIGMEYHGRDEL